MKRLLVILGALCTPLISSAHEAYVLSPTDFDLGMHDRSVDAWQALQNPHDFHLFLVITAGVIVALLLGILFQVSKAGKTVHNWFAWLENFGPLVVRVTLGVAFILSAFTNSFLGPELRLDVLPFPIVWSVALFILGLMFITGIGTEIAAALGAIAFIAFTTKVGWYMFSYLNYAGELAVLLLFGAGSYSLDRYLFGPLKRFKKWAKHEKVVIRTTYGIALAFAAINVKLIHSLTTLMVVKQYNLTQFHLLFPSDPLLVVLGGGLAELAIGLFIILGFELRLTLLVSLFYITLSLLFFRESVWPHAILYAISFYLLVGSNPLSIDSWLQKKLGGK